MVKSNQAALLASVASNPQGDAAKADALEAEAKRIAQQKADLVAAREAGFARFEELGASNRQASGAKTSAGYIFNAMCRAGHMTEDDAAAAYARFAAGHNAALVKVTIGNEEIDVATELLAVDDAAKISKWKNFGRWQVLHMGLDWFERVARIHAAIPYKQRKASAYNSLASATSRYCELSGKANITDAEIRAGKFDVDDATIAEWLTKEADDEKAKSTKTDAEKAGLACSALNKAAKPGTISGLMDLVKAVTTCLAHHELTKDMKGEEKRMADIKAGYATADELLRLVA